MAHEGSTPRELPNLVPIERQWLEFMSDSPNFFIASVAHKTQEGSIQLLAGTMPGQTIETMNERFRGLNAEALLSSDDYDLLAEACNSALSFDQPPQPITVQFMTEDSARDVQLSVMKGNPRHGLIENHLYIVGTDITDTLTEHRRNEAYTRQLEQRTALQDSLLHMARHDIRSELSLAQSAMFMLRDIEGLAEEDSEIVKLADGGIGAALRVLDILNQVQVTANAEIMVEPTSTRDILNTLLDQYSPLVQSAKADPEKNFKAIALTVDTVDDSDYPILVNPAMFERVLANFIRNSIKYMDRTKDGRKIVITPWADEEGTHIKIADNGIGIPPQFREQFGTTLGRRYHSEFAEGTGVGSVVSYFLIQRMNGTVSLESWEDGEDGHESGTEITITFPSAPSIREEMIINEE